jgi:hypothetical protein
MYCGECGTQSTEGDTFCATCGEPLVAQTAVAAVHPPPPPQVHVYVPGAPVVQATNGMAVAALVCGILGIFVLALIFGYVGRRQIDESYGRYGGRGMATAGIVLGWIGLVLFVLWIVLIIVVLVAATHTPAQ